MRTSHRLTARLVLALCLATGGSVLASSLVPTVALAQDKTAERLRLEEEMKRLAQRNAWAGVERKYNELLALNIDLPFDDHQVGAQAARSLGKTLEVYERLLRAQKIQASDEIIQELAAIDSQYGRVELKGSERFLVPVKPAVMPFAPDQRKSVEWAEEVMTNTGSFRGMLPLGTYKVACQEFEVVAGPNFLTIPVEKPKKKELEACLAGQGLAGGGGDGTGPSAADYTEGIIGYHGFVGTVGYNFMSNSAPKDPVADLSNPDLYQAQGQSVTGSGISAQLGYEIGFNGANKMFGTALTVGYTGMYGGRTQYADRPASFNGGNAWLAATIRPGDLRIAVGPTWNLYYGEGTGVACWFELAPNEDWDPPATGSDPERCSRPDQQTYEPNNIEWRGFSVAPGAAFAVGFAPVELFSNEEGFGLRGVVELGGSWATDGNRQIINAGVRVGVVPHIKRFNQ